LASPILSSDGHRALAAHVLPTVNPRLLDVPGPEPTAPHLGWCAALLLSQAGDIMATFAQIHMEPGGLIAWLIVGLVAGFLAGRVMRGSGYGVFGDIVVGLVGAVIGGFLYGQVVTGDYGLLGSIVVAFLGACLLIWVVRQFAPGRSYA
jgi:uncharacterized membrane protein YeaQ/YmgE (transglycosylase-associated protein family)